LTKAFPGTAAILLVAMLLVSMTPQTCALPPADAAEWQVGFFWKYEGVLLLVNVSIEYLVSSRESVTVGENSYDAFRMDTSATYRLWGITTTTTGKDYYDAYSYGLIKSESITTTGNDVRTSVVVYEPPKMLVMFPMALGDEWNESVHVTSVDTVKGVRTETKTWQNTTYKVEGIDVVNASGNQIDCFRIKATNETGSSLNYWYSEDIGNFVKLDIFLGVGSSEVVLKDYSYWVEEDPEEPSFWEGQTFMLILVLIIVVVVIAVVAAVALRKRKQAQPTQQAAAQATTGSPAAQAQPAGMIEDVFLVYRDGRLIHHDARRLKPEVDQEVMSGMFTAIQDFVSRSFPTADGTVGPVKEIKYANSRILLEQGRFIYLAVVTDIVDAALLQARMASLVKLIEAKCLNELQAWDGNMDSVLEAKRLSRLMLSDEPIPTQ